MQRGYVVFLGRYLPHMKETVRSNPLCMLGFLCLVQPVGQCLTQSVLLQRMKS